MDNTHIAQTINEALAEEFELDADALVSSAHIRNDLGLDSLDIVDMVIVLEKTFHFKLADKEPLTHIQTLGDIHGFICSLRDAGTIKA